jgi:hypothetical protein
LAMRKNIFPTEMAHAPKKIKLRCGVLNFPGGVRLVSHSQKLTCHIEPTALWKLASQAANV